MGWLSAIGRSVARAVAGGRAAAAAAASGVASGLRSIASAVESYFPAASIADQRSVADHIQQGMAAAEISSTMRSSEVIDAELVPDFPEPSPILAKTPDWRYENVGVFVNDVTGEVQKRNFRIDSDVQMTQAEIEAEIEDLADEWQKVSPDFLDRGLGNWELVESYIIFTEKKAK
jgi:hypothetical protein